MDVNWRVYSKRADFNAISKKYNIDPVVARVIRNRDVVTDEQIEMFLYGNLNKVHDPRILKDMEKGTDIILNKIKEKKKIRIISDYDVDGVMSNYILLDGLKRAGADVSYKIPDRINDGYGINEKMIEQAVSDGVDTIITCDNGISAVNAIALAKEKGLTVVVTDHHEVKPERVNADAVIDPKQPECSYPFKEICGTTVAYKFIRVLFDKMKIKMEQDEYLEFVAIATNCDVMELTDENRIYVREGLKKLIATNNIGLRALLNATELNDGRELNTFHLGFVIGPCINAAGRLKSANLALDLLMSKDMEQASFLAEELKDLNETRKKMTEEGVEKARKIISEKKLDKNNVLVICIEELHESLAGIVAGRIKEEFYRPTIVFTKSIKDEEILKGSGRSIEGYNMFEGLLKCEEVLYRFGGHELAAGLSIEKDKLDSFISMINENEEMTEDVLMPKLFIDVPMPASYVTIKLIEQLNALAPFGKGNEKPVFAEANMRVASAAVLGKNRNVLKLKLMDKNGFKYEAIYFNVEEFINNIKMWFTEEECDKMFNGYACDVTLDVAYQPDINEYNDRRTIQFRVLNYRKSAKE